MFKILLLTSCLSIVSCFVASKNDNSNDPPGIWIGTAPFCGATPRDCDLFDLDYVRKDKHGDGSYCESGYKVLCRVKPIENLAMYQNDTPDNEFRAVTFNIYQRPYIVSHDGQYVRTCHIPRAILQQIPNIDVIIFEEAFLDGCIPNLDIRKIFKYYGFNYSTPTVGKHSYYHTRLQLSKIARYYMSLHDPRLAFINGGAFILSKWPIESYQIHIYQNSCGKTADYLASKGIVHAKIWKNKQIYNIFGTHMQAQDGIAEDAVRILQAKEIRVFIDSLNLPKNQPVILCGDLNSDRIGEPQQVAEIMQIINITIPQRIGTMNASFDGDINDVVEKPYKKQWIDYTTYSNRHRLPKKSHMKGIYLKTYKQITYCDEAKLLPTYVPPYSEVCEDDHTTFYMSDHFPVVGTFIF